MPAAVPPALSGQKPEPGPEKGYKCGDGPHTATLRIRNSVYPLLLPALPCIAVFAGPAAAATPFQNLDTCSRLSRRDPDPPLPWPCPPRSLPISYPLTSRRTLSISSLLITIQPGVPENHPSWITPDSQNRNAVSWDDLFIPVTPRCGCGGC